MKTTKTKGSKASKTEAKSPQKKNSKQSNTTADTVRRKSATKQPDMLKTFKANNPQCSIREEDETLIVEKPWGDDSSRFVFKLNEKKAMEDLNNVLFLPQFDAIIHLDTNTIEFIYGYLLPDDTNSKSHMDRAFEFFYREDKFECKFAAPTKRLMNLAVRYKRRAGTEPGPGHQILAFRDAQKADELGTRVKEYFDKRSPRSFFIKPSQPVREVDLEAVARHINFLAYYYDRKTAVIEIRPNEADEVLPTFKPLVKLDENFPQKLAIKELDGLLLQLVETARKSPSRFAFVYYFQVIEYAAFHFLDAKQKRALTQILRDPSIVSCGEDKLTELFSLLPLLNQAEDDKKKMVLNEFCRPREIWLEIENDRNFFSSPILFDGGVEIPGLISNGITVEEWEKHKMLKLFENIRDIRNLLVHAREKRQNNVILPTRANNRKLQRYLPVIRRVAEQITLYRE